jgi:hypothetical protein
VEGRGLSRFRPALVVRSPSSPRARGPRCVLHPALVPPRLEVCTVTFFITARRFCHPRHSPRPCSEQQRSVDPLPQHSGDLLPQRAVAAVSSGVGDVGSSSISLL